MKTTGFFYLAAALMVAATLTTSCKDDKEPGEEPSDVQGLFINEVCSGGTDWIELYNANSTDMDLSGYHVQDNKGTDEEYTFPAGSSIEAKGYLVLEEGTFEFGISGDGDAITILDENYAEIDHVQVPAMEDGYTYSRMEDGASSWETVAGGTKGRSNSGELDDIEVPEQPEQPGESESPVLINEVQGATIDGEQTDFIELYNPSDAAVDISGYILQDDKGAEEQYVVPEGTQLEAGAFMAFYKDESFTFGLGGSGDVVTVLDADGNLVDIIEYPEMEDGSSYARIPDGSDTWETCAAPTPGESNEGTTDTPEEPAVDYTVLKLNEINCDDKNDVFKFIEIYNTSDSEISLSGVYFTKNDNVEGDEKYVIGEVTIPAKGFFTMWSDKDDEFEKEVEFDFGISADKSLKIELFSPDGTSLDVFKNLDVNGEENWDQDEAKYDAKKKGAFAREKDGDGDWYIMKATPDASNNEAEKVEDNKIEW